LRNEINQFWRLIFEWYFLFMITVVFSDWVHSLTASQLSYKMSWRINIIVLLKIKSQCLSNFFELLFSLYLLLHFLNSFNQINCHRFFLFLFLLVFFVPKIPVVRHSDSREFITSRQPALGIAHLSYQQVFGAVVGDRTRVTRMTGENTFQYTTTTSLNVWKSWVMKHI
jgi:hypothetical protein